MQADRLYLDSGNHNSWVLISSVDNSVSVEAAECAWFGVDGKLFLINRFHVLLRSIRRIKKLMTLDLIKLKLY